MDMFCSNCGKEIDNNNKFCPYCGYSLKPDANIEMPIEQSKKLILKNKKIICIIAVCIVVIVLIGNLIGGSNAKEAVEKLQTFTYAEKANDRCTFESSGIWRLIYTEENTVVEFDESAVIEYLMYSFGTYDVGNDGTFMYDLDENEIRIYLDITTEEGHFTIINYNLKKGEVYFNKDGEHYSATQAFTDEINNYGIIDIMKEDINQFKSELNYYDLSVDQLEQIKYKDIVKYI